MKKAGLYFSLNINETALNNIKAALTSKAFVKVGVLDSGAKEAGAAYIAMVHEFGASPTVTPKMRGWFHHHFGVWIKKAHIHIPARSFFRLTLAQRSKAFTGYLEKNRDGIFDKIVNGQWRGALYLFGAQWVAYIQECFDTKGFGQWAPLHPLTIMTRKNGSDVPLQDTGRLKASITHEVEG